MGEIARSSSMRLLCLSNGHGEDQIALRILEELRRLSDGPTIAVLPIVGDGSAYRQAEFTVIGPTQTMPSGGFINLDAGRQLARDIEAGLLKLTWSQIQTVRQWAKAAPLEKSLILAVGDIVPLLFAGWVKLPFAFVGTAKSEYYLRDETGWLVRDNWWDDRFLRWTGCVYLPWERWLMRRSGCVAVFPRDPLTAGSLRQFRIPAFDLGNPMMDGLGAVNRPLMPAVDDRLTIALIPGSRVPEVYANWALMVQAVQGLADRLGRSVDLLAALTPAGDRAELLKPLRDWELVAEDQYQFASDDHRMNLTLCPGKFVDCSQRSHLAIAMAGTATEQFVGLGKPVITFPGAGPQFVPAFAEAQTRLLGRSVHLVQTPDQVADKIQQLLAADPEDWQAIAANGLRRMGCPGGAARIANCLMQEFQWRSGEGRR
jgi:uncharacterized protein (TIGR03492 family)